LYVKSAGKGPEIEYVPVELFLAGVCIDDCWRLKLEVIVNAANGGGIGFEGSMEEDVSFVHEISYISA
jgi:hypothetical protein